MLKQRRVAAQQLTDRLFETESAIDVAIQKMADLEGFMPVTRKNANLSAVVGQDAVLQAGQTLTALIPARSEIVATHNCLAVARDQIGSREMGMGSDNGKPPLHARHGNEPVVALVTEAA
ncbi:hypothetical protein [Parasphingorhabdus halotolerans]|uniref:Uncharacterized protein n=1 Tax=Parasphingorhabdus halotolerans TaxID=2725558 RepID=A0A6H2DKS9_9SPHN|nr:hypothetical protein [Parasphingorhabdus halotolerans]QJB69269.1 hypothetical protein HF685_08245 [Parasphingorhabdus halotolerans]